VGILGSISNGKWYHNDRVLSKRRKLAAPGPEELTFLARTAWWNLKGCRSVYKMRPLGKEGEGAFAMQKPRTARESSDWVQEPAEKESLGGTGFVVILLVLLAVIVVCVIGIIVVRTLRSDGDVQQASLPGLVTGTSLLTTLVPSPHPSEAASSSDAAEIGIQPQQGYINTLVNVAGQGWWPGEPVFVFLRSPAEAEGQGHAYAYAAAVADDAGNIRTALTFPNEMRWMDQPWAEVLARGTRSQRQATARFELIVPTPTPTMPPPTALPTRLATDTPVPTSTSWPTPTATPTPVIITDWRAEYFANAYLGGDPALIRNDVAIAFDWGIGPPDPRIPADSFSVRWTRQIDFLEGYYRFVLWADDGVRLWVDGVLLVDEWHDGVLTDYVVEIYLPRGPHALRLEYYENLGEAMAQLQWSQGPPPTPSITPTPSSTPTATATPTFTPMPSLTPTFTPTSTPTPTPSPTATSQPPPPVPGAVLPEVWQGEYFANPNLEEPPAMQRQDSTLAFHWGDGSPDSSLPVDGFSVRWRGELELPAGNYGYVMRVDDGARFWIDGQLVIDAWALAPEEPRYGQAYLEEGVHSFRVEYYETEQDAFIELQGSAGGD
jgi:hypothetical protein